MKKIISTNLQLGMITAEAIYSLDNKQTLIPSGCTLTENSIRMINNWDIPFVMIMEEEPNRQDIATPEPEYGNVAVLPEIMAQKTMNFLNNLEEATSRVNSLLENIRAGGSVELDYFREVAVQVARHLTQPTEAINKMLFQVPPPTANNYLTKHTLAVAAIAGMLADWLELPAEELQEVVLAGLLHDLGKTQLPRSIIADNNPDTERQEILKQHVFFTLKLLKDIPQLSTGVLTAAVQHHELMDGSGYPQSLSGDNIHLYARIVSVADRLTEIVSHSLQVDPFVIAETIKTEMFDKLDPFVCDVLVRRFNDYLMNNWLKLSNGSKAKIVFLSNLNSTTTVLQTEDNKIIDLTKEPGVKIEGIIF